MRRYVCCSLTAGVAIVLIHCTATARAQEEESQPVNIPTIKFFYYDAGKVEWAMSAEPDRLRAHLASHADSQALHEAVSSAVVASPDPDRSAEQMTRWIESERERFDETRREAPRARMAEGIVAYLRAHDFSIHNLVDALERRSGASDVELVVVHLLDAQGESSYKLKVVLVDPEVEIGKQGFNVNLAAPEASYTVVAYALGLALYELQEVLNRDSPEEEPAPGESIEALPVPEPVDA